MPYLGPLSAYEVVSDLRWTPVLAAAGDIDTWASIGAGCANGLEWIATGQLGTHDSSPGHVPDQLAQLCDLLAMSRDAANWPRAYVPWEAREAEHWSCEVAKIVKARDGGSLKRRFHPPVPTPRTLWDPAECRA